MEGTPAGEGEDPITADTAVQAEVGTPAEFSKGDEDASDFNRTVRIDRDAVDDVLKSDKKLPIPLIAAALAGLLGLRFLTADDGYPALMSLRGDLRGLNVEIRELSDENRRLLEAITALRHDPHAVERIAREDLDLVAPGEILYLFPGEMAPGEDRQSALRGRR